ncbi:MAG: butyrate kinase [Synergistales bacterium]|nr:butyrate kinase [Synergistales bacterium]
MTWKVLVVNTGSTSTKLAFYRDRECIVREEIKHPHDEISGFASIFDQYEYRLQIVREFMDRNGIRIEDLSAASARGGHTRPLQGGVYRINSEMLSQIASGDFGRHPCDLSSAIAYSLVKGGSAVPVVVDPPVTDELDQIARLSGHPLISRRSRFHALNLKAVARKAAETLGKQIEEVDLIGVHMGGGISVCACRKGRMVDCNNALDGDGPYAPERSGGLPVWDLVELCLSGRFSREQLRKMIVGEGGLMAYLGSKDVLSVEELIEEGNREAEIALEGMTYQVSKEIGAMAAVLEGRVDAVYVTGGIANSGRVVSRIRERVGFLAPMLLFPGEFEMEALAFGAIRVLEGEEMLRAL